MFKRFWIFIFCIPFVIQATDLKPWFPRYLEIQPRFTYLHQYYSKVDTNLGTQCKISKNDFYTGSIELAYDNICGELETTVASTGGHHLAFDDVSGTFRYLLLDDVIGDPVSLVAGVTVTQVFSPALRDINTFYHGGIEAEFHLSIGKEVTSYNTWDSRTWGVAGLGIADHGSPWVHGELAWEKNWCERQHFRIFAEGIYGLGRHSLDLCIPFHGYGSIRHQSIDVGALYKYFFWDANSLTLGYAYRVHSKNCPKNVSSIFVSYMHPFGL